MLQNLRYVAATLSTLDLETPSSAKISLRNDKVYGGCCLQVKATLVAGAPMNATCEAVVLDTPLLPGKTTTLETYSVLMSQLVPKPKEITQTDVQRVLFTASRYPLSPYKIATASTQVSSSQQIALQRSNSVELCVVTTKYLLDHECGCSACRSNCPARTLSRTKERAQCQSRGRPSPMGQTLMCHHSVEGHCRSTLRTMPPLQRLCLW